MGWKNVKEHYRIRHIVHVAEGNLHIGSPYISDLIVVSPEGEIKKSRDGSLVHDLGRYVQEISADPALFVRLFSGKDSFSAAIPVYTFRDGEIIEHACEEPGWPNVTHDGRVMYENTFFVDRHKAVEAARKDAASGIRHFERRIEDLRDDIKRTMLALDQQRAALAKLNGEDSVPSPTEQ